MSTPGAPTLAPRTAGPKQALPVDREVGGRIAALRAAHGLSQTALAGALGVSFQQVQKYETGRNRVGAGRLQAIAAHLGVPVSTFFVEDAGEGPAGAELDLLRLPGAVDLLRAYAAIADERVRRDVVSLVRSAVRLAPRRDQAQPA